MGDIETALTRIDELAVEVLNRGAMVGLGLGVVHDGELVATRYYGLADVASRRPVTAETTFRVGSISKTMTGIGVMQLVEQGLVDLDDPVHMYVTRYPLGQPDGSRPATVRDMLTHTSGIGELRRLGDVFAGPQGGLGVEHGKPIPAMLDYYARGLRSEIEPGRKWSYSNHAFATLGQLVEEVSGQPFTDYMSEHVLEPLGMGSSDFVRSERVRKQLATGYALKRGKLAAVPDLDIVVQAAGSVYSTVPDMARYVAALMNGGANDHGKVLRSETLDEMYRSHWSIDERIPGQGLAFLLDRFRGHRIVGHDGGWPGFISSVLIAPDEKLGVVAFTNRGSAALHNVADTVLRSLLGVPQAGDDLPRPGVPVRPELWDEFAGVYAPWPGFLTNLRTWAAYGGELQVFVRDNKLMVRTLLGALRTPHELHPVDPGDPYFFETLTEQDGLRLPLRLAFRRGQAGEVNEVAGRGLLPFHFRKRPPLRSVRNMARLGAGTGTAAAVIRGLRRRGERR